jgi:Cytochrome c
LQLKKRETGRIATLGLRGLPLLSLLLAQAGCSDVADSNVALLERGTYLAEGIAGCGNCHTPRTADGTLIDDRKLAGAFVIERSNVKAYAPNITPDEETGIGSWTDEQIIHAIREGIRPDGSILGPPMPFVFYRGISDRDVQSLVAYLRSLPAVRNAVPRSVYYVPPPSSWGPPVTSVAEVSRDDAVIYGGYLAGPIGHCIDCHTLLENGKIQFDRVGGGGNVYSKPFGYEFAVISSNITPHPELGIGAWSDAEIKRAVTTGVSRDGRPLLPFMGFSFYKNIDDRDLDAIVAYLRTLPPWPPAED